MVDDPAFAGRAHARIRADSSRKGRKGQKGNTWGPGAVSFPHSQESRNVRKCEGVKVVLKF